MRGVSSYIKTTSPTFTFCLFVPVVLWCFRNEVRYSCFHLDLKCCKVSACCFALRFMLKLSPKFGSSNSSSSTDSWGNEVILRPYSKCAGVSGSISSSSEGVYVNGLSFRTASISTTRVSSTINDTWALPNIFFKAVFVRPIKCSHHPSYQGARFGINFHIIIQ